MDASRSKGRAHFGIQTNFFFYVLDVIEPNGKHNLLTAASEISLSSKAASLLAANIKTRTGTIPISYLSLPIRELLDQVRSDAKSGGFDFSDPFLPPLGPQLDKLLAAGERAGNAAAIVTAGQTVRAAMEAAT